MTAGHRLAAGQVRGCFGALWEGGLGLPGHMVALVHCGSRKPSRELTHKIANRNCKPFGGPLTLPRTIDLAPWTSDPGLLGSLWRPPEYLYVGSERKATTIKRITFLSDIKRDERAKTDKSKKSVSFRSPRKKKKKVIEIINKHVILNR